MRLDNDQRTSLTWWFGVAIVAAETAGDVFLDRSPDPWILGIAAAFVFGLPGAITLLRLVAAIVGAIGSSNQQPGPEDNHGDTDDA